MTTYTPSAPLDGPTPQAADKRFIDAPLPRALLSILLVISGHFAIGYSLKFGIGEIVIGGYTVIISVWASTLLAALVLLWVKASRGDFSSLGLTRPRSYWKGALTGTLGGIGVLVALTLPIQALVSAGLMPPLKEGATGMLVSGPDLVTSLSLSLTVMWINAAFCEELLFRGFLMNTVHNALGNSWKTGLAAAVIVSLFFGIVHVPSQGLYGLVATGLAGISLGILFLFGKRNLFPVVIAHGVVNTISIVAMATGTLQG